ncbi:MAG TPA: hypothetical protein VEM96_15350 [Pyrinomonadaceae bacterium]|nr:hypothetical protein [Pyrinomonadaceae bacterium]
MSTKIKLTKRLFIDHGKDIERVLQRAVHDALRMHKRIGNPIAIWKDGRVVIIPPEEIVIPPDDFETKD